MMEKSDKAFGEPEVVNFPNGSTAKAKDNRIIFRWGMSLGRKKPLLAALFAFIAPSAAADKRQPPFPRPPVWPPALSTAFTK